jgi:tetratricopeptide (TPR) repeat protein
MRSKEWEQAAQILEEIHRRGLGTSWSHHYLGLALLQLHRWDEAVEEYEAIERPVRDPASNSWRLLNHSIALYEVGRKRECAELLRSSIDATWAEEPLRRAKGLLAEFQDEQ